MRVVGLPSPFYRVAKTTLLELTPEAQERLRWVNCWRALRQQGVTSSAAAVALGKARSTMYRWDRLLRDKGPDHNQSQSPWCTQRAAATRCIGAQTRSFPSPCGSQAQGVSCGTAWGHSAGGHSGHPSPARSSAQALHREGRGLAVGRDRGTYSCYVHAGGTVPRLDAAAVPLPNQGHPGGRGIRVYGGLRVRLPGVWYQAVRIASALTQAQWPRGESAADPYRGVLRTV